MRPTTPAPDAFDRLLTLQEVGTVLGKSPRAVSMMIQRQQLEGVRLGRGFRVRVSVLLAFLNALPPAVGHVLTLRGKLRGMPVLNVLQWVVSVDWADVMLCLRLQGLV